MLEYWFVNSSGILLLGSSICCSMSTLAFKKPSFLNNIIKRALFVRHLIHHHLCLWRISYAGLMEKNLEYCSKILILIRAFCVDSYISLKHVLSDYKPIVSSTYLSWWGITWSCLCLQFILGKYGLNCSN